MESIWLKSSKKKNYEQLNEDIETDVLIIGGGISGIQLAYELSKTNLSIVLVDQNELYHGTTGYTTGKVTVQHGYIYHNLARDYGGEFAKEYYLANLLGLNRIKQIIEELNIDCDFTTAESILFDTSIDKVLLNQEEKAYRHIGIPYTLTNYFNYPALAIDNQAHFNVIKYLDGILNYLNQRSNVKIYENTKVIKCEMNNGVIAFTKHHTIKCQDLISASFYPIYKKFNFFFTKLEPVMSYVTIAKNAKNNEDKMAINISHPIISIRKVNDQMIMLAGLSNEVGKLNSFDDLEILKEMGTNFFNIQDYSSEWYNQDYQTPDHLPLIGKIVPHIYMMSGYNKWGMTTSAYASLIITDLITKGESLYQNMFNPNRLTKLTKRVTYIGKSIGVLLISKIKYPKYHRNVSSKTKVKMICPHMLCTLRYNPISDSFDCPCHGSRFTITGEIINGPSTKNLDIIQK